MLIPTPPVDNQADFDVQHDMAKEGMLAAVRLRRWLIDNQETLRRWQELVQGSAT